MKNKTVLIIPAYEPSHNFVNYAREIIEQGFHSIVVVNDGSNEKYNEIFEELSAIPSCHLISYEENRGKGYALKCAFKYCKDTYDDTYVFATADCDGQHLVKDVEKVAKTAYEHPEKLILGSRDFTLEHVPARSKAGNLNIRRMFKFFYGLSLSDTQTGLRAFSYHLLDNLISIRGNRFEYEMNMLIVLHKARIAILEVPIETVYHPKEDDVERVSHFKTFSDSVLVVATLFKNLGLYMFSSIASLIVDMGAFFILSTYVFVGSESIAYNVLLATACSRIISSILNFTLNYKLVFRGQSKKSIIKYYILWIFQLTASYGIALGWSAILNYALSSAVTIGILTTVLKTACDLTISVFSYQLQSRWVFVSVERSRVYFYGTFFRIFRHIYGLFKRKYKNYVIAHETQPSIYICKGSVNECLMKLTHNISFDMHPTVQEHLVTFKDCRKHFSTYTFTKKKERRGIKKFFGKIFAFFAAAAFVPFVKALKPVPLSDVHDNENKYDGALKHLAKRENILTFVNLTYTEEEKLSIIKNILNIQKEYSNISTKPLSFNVIAVDNAKLEIHQIASFEFPIDADFDEARTELTEKIYSALK